MAQGVRASGAHDLHGVGRHALDKTAAAKLPKVTGTPSFPTEDQQSKAKTVIAQGWAKAVSG